MVASTVHLAAPQKLDVQPPFLSFFSACFAVSSRVATLILMFVLAALALIAFASTISPPINFGPGPDLTQVYINNATYGGSGCP